MLSTVHVQTGQRSRKPNIKTPETPLPQHYEAAACVIAQQYSTATYVILHFNILLRLATDWTVRGSNPGGGGEIFRNRPDRPWGPISLLYNGYRVFHGGKAAGEWR